MIDWLTSLFNTPYGPILLFIVVFTVAFLESLAVVGLLIPGVAILFMLAATAAHHEASFYWLVFAAALGAFSGDCLSYYIGCKSNSFNTVQLYLNRHSQSTQKATNLCNRHGAFGLLIGRFIGPLRPFMPITAGLLHFPRLQFYCIALIGAAIWAPVYLGPGYFLGYWPAFNLQIMLALGCLALSPYLLKYLAQTALSLKVKRLGMLSACLFFSLACWVYSESSTSECGYLCQLNTLVQSAVQTLQAKAVSVSIPILWLFSFLSSSCSTLIVIILGCAFVFWSSRKGNWPRVLWLLIAFIAPLALKAIMGIERPGTANEANYSFPSSHTYFSYLIVLIACENFSIHIKKTWFLLLGWASLVAFSRLMLDANWLSDIAGSWLLALAVFSCRPCKSALRPSPTSLDSNYKRVTNTSRLVHKTSLEQSP